MERTARTDDCSAPEICGPIEVFGLDPDSYRQVAYTLTVKNDLVGVDVWVNDVYLGKTPVKTTLAEPLERRAGESDRSDPPCPAASQ